MSYAEARQYEDTAAMKRQGHVTRQLEDMDMALNQLEKQGLILEERLHSVIRDAEPDHTGPGAVDDSLVPLADQYRDHVRRVGRIADRLQYLTDRIEL